MPNTSNVWNEEIIPLAGTNVQIVKGGSGPPLLIFNDELGGPGWLNYHQMLSNDFTLYIPSLPGYGKSEPLPWINNMRDMAGWCLQALDELNLGKINVMGFSLGGWIASELATMCPHNFEKLVLVGAMGIRPTSGEILDMFMLMPDEYLAAGFVDPTGTEEFLKVCPEEPSDDLDESWMQAREHSSRLGWKPYMNNFTLPHLLNRINQLPTLIVWGAQDKVVPISAAKIYHQSIKNSRLEIFENCGHRPEIERIDKFVDTVNNFLSGQT